MESNNNPVAEKFGTFLGVYTPSVLTILGLIMYLRFGWVVGNLGLGMTLLVVLVATARIVPRGIDFRGSLRSPLIPIPAVNPVTAGKKTAKTYQNPCGAVL